MFISLSNGQLSLLLQMNYQYYILKFVYTPDIMSAPILSSAYISHTEQNPLFMSFIWMMFNNIYAYVWCHNNAKWKFL